MADSVCETNDNIRNSTEALESSKRSLDNDFVINSCKDVSDSPHTKLSSESFSELEEISKKLKSNYQPNCNDENLNDNLVSAADRNGTPVTGDAEKPTSSPTVTSSLDGLCSNSIYNLPLDFHTFLAEYKNSLEKESSTAKSPGDIFSDYKPHAYTDVVFRRKRNHVLAEKFSQIYGLYNKSHQMKLSDVEPEIFDFIFQHLEQK